MPSLRELPGRLKSMVKTARQGRNGGDAFEELSHKELAWAYNRFLEVMEETAGEYEFEEMPGNLEEMCSTLLKAVQKIQDDCLGHGIEKRIELYEGFVNGVKDWVGRMLPLAQKAEEGSEWEAVRDEVESLREALVTLSETENEIRNQEDTGFRRVTRLAEARSDFIKVVEEKLGAQEIKLAPRHPAMVLRVAIKELEGCEDWAELQGLGSTVLERLWRRSAPTDDGQWEQRAFHFLELVSQGEVGHALRTYNGDSRGLEHFPTPGPRESLDRFISAMKMIEAKIIESGL